MSPSDDDLRARLRAADPAAGLSPADPVEVDRLLQRVVDADLRETGTRRRSPLTWLVAAAAVVVLAAGAALWLTQTGDGDNDGGLLADPAQSSSPAETGTSELTVGAAGAGRCIMPTPELLAGQPIAFSGTVEGVTDGVVTIRTKTVFKGEVADEVAVKGAVAPDTGGAPEGDPEFVPGQDYLVAAADGKVLGCGMSGPVSGQLQQLYQQAFPQ
ncbi:hypothetical protein SAMN04487968_11395 [Nocardioides terrae]|uniref:Uncharacterized protein n=1 Tax=Nocardioides terrae TaxID=574651 RepID=A0A1I1N628_9ACTN|nr:hypothetical protein [Nocardioides terrae]SFC89200.1 hypothetical protein SAMN04487968_11395 [Nocardioides terrae]